VDKNMFKKIIKQSRRLKTEQKIKNRAEQKIKNNLKQLKYRQPQSSGGV